ncbi:calcineurin inhibitor, partial [Cichlidogyrus casuarinus]
MEYDHEQFLGKDMSDEMDDLPTDQVIMRLGKIFDKIDLNKDGKLDTYEMVKWMRNLSQTYMKADTDRVFSESGVPEGQQISWQIYSKDLTRDSPDTESVKEILGRDKKRWDLVDEDHDGLLSKEEFMTFLHPEEFEITRPSIAQ